MHEVTYDGSEWHCDLHDSAHSVLVTATKEQMEVALDLLEATGRLKEEDAEWLRQEVLS